MIWDCFSASRVRDLVKTDAITELRNLEKHLIGLIFHPKCNAIKAYLDLKKNTLQNNISHGPDLNISDYLKKLQESFPMRVEAMLKKNPMVLVQEM